MGITVDPTILANPATISIVLRPSLAEYYGIMVLQRTIVMFYAQLLLFSIRLGIS
jgi:hypothetical protein